MSMNKKLRHQKILDLVRDGAVASQEHLRSLLEDDGFLVTQSTLSRDIKELELVKGGRGYQLPVSETDAPFSPTKNLKSAAGEYLVRCSRAHNQVVLRTAAGHAHPLALAIDRANLPGILGTIAGDDTILLIAQDDQAAASVQQQLSNMTPRRESS